MQQANQGANWQNPAFVDFMGLLFLEFRSTIILPTDTFKIKIEGKGTEIWVQYKLRPQVIWTGNVDDGRQDYKMIRSTYNFAPENVMEESGGGGAANLVAALKKLVGWALATGPGPSRQANNLLKQVRERRAAGAGEEEDLQKAAKISALYPLEHYIIGSLTKGKVTFGEWAGEGAAIGHPLPGESERGLKMRWDHFCAPRGGRSSGSALLNVVAAWAAGRRASLPPAIARYAAGLPAAQAATVPEAVVAFFSTAMKEGEQFNGQSLLLSMYNRKGLLRQAISLLNFKLSTRLIPLYQMPNMDELRRTTATATKVAAEAAARLGKTIPYTGRGAATNIIDNFCFTSLVAKQSSPLPGDAHEAAAAVTSAAQQKCGGVEVNIFTHAPVERGGACPISGNIGGVTKVADLNVILENKGLALDLPKGIVNVADAIAKNPILIFNIGVWVIVDLPKAPHSLVAIIKGGRIFTIGAGYHQPETHQQFTGNWAGPLKVFTPDNGIYKEGTPNRREQYEGVLREDVMHDQYISDMGFYNKGMEERLKKVVTEGYGVRNSKTGDNSYIMKPGFATYSTASGAAISVVCSKCVPGGNPKMNCKSFARWLTGGGTASAQRYWLVDEPTACPVTLQQLASRTAEPGISEEEQARVVQGRERAAYYQAMRKEGDASIAARRPAQVAAERLGVKVALKAEDRHVRAARARARTAKKRQSGARASQRRARRHTPAAVPGDAADELARRQALNYGFDTHEEFRKAVDRWSVPRPGSWPARPTTAAIAPAKDVVMGTTGGRRRKKTRHRKKRRKRTRRQRYRKKKTHQRRRRRKNRRKSRR